MNTFLGLLLVLSLLGAFGWMVQKARKMESTPEPTEDENAVWQYKINEKGLISIMLDHWAVLYKPDNSLPTLISKDVSTRLDSSLFEVNGRFLLTEGRIKSNLFEEATEFDLLELKTDRGRAHLAHCINGNKPLTLDGEEYPPINMKEVDALRLKLLAKKETALLDVVAEADRQRLIEQRRRNAI